MAGTSCLEGVWRRGVANYGRNLGHKCGQRDEFVFMYRGRFGLSTWRGRLFRTAGSGQFWQAAKHMIA
jgi:hypothetical protein